MPKIDVFAYEGTRPIGWVRMRPIRKTPDGFAGVVFGRRLYHVFRARHEHFSIDTAGPSWSKDSAACPIVSIWPPIIDSDRINEAGVRVTSRSVHVENRSISSTKFSSSSDRDQLVGAFVTTVVGDEADQFATFRTGPDGIGRVKGIVGREAEVEYFVSPAGPRLVTRRIDRRQLKPVSLMLETVVFSQDPTSGTWHRGRVIARESADVAPVDERYRVRFPNDFVQVLPVSDLYVRWAHPIDDPLEYVAARVTDTPFFFEGRRRIVRNLAEQRALFGGLTGLASAAIDLLPHQVAIARRVLADPVERYLLADEVGLGKTIEAGIIIRQHLLDCPGSARVLVVVPLHLVDQWRLELDTRFGIASGDQRVVVADEFAAQQVRTGEWSMLVVDEAHRVAPGAFDETASRERRLFGRLRDLAKATPRVLLLSGTPVLRQEDGFLAMLHLLDPEAYRLADREAFRQRVAARSDVADATAQLTEGAPGFFLEQAVQRLKGAFGNDPRLNALGMDVMRLADEDESSQERDKAIRALRLHVTEAYKLHRRMLRTRRDDPTVLDLLGRRNGIEILECHDEPRALAWELVEAWRAAMPLDAMGARPQRGQGLLATLVEAGLSHPLAVQTWFEQRAGVLRSRNSEGEELFQGEAAWCGSALRRLASVVQEEPRSQELAAWIQKNGGKAIVFVDRADVAARVCRELRGRLGAAVVAYLDDPASQGFGPTGPVEAFVRNSAVKVIVADRRAEEGLNLQRVQATLVHYDLPMAPTRIEQRNGRVDRLEAKRSPRFVAFAGASEYETAWIEYLRATVRVFSRSVAPLQYALADSCDRLGRGFLALGAEAFAEESRRLASPDGLEAELAAIRHQEALDSISLDSAQEKDFFKAMYAGDERESEHAGVDCDAWLKERLQFWRKPCGSKGGAGSGLHYAYSLAKQPLLPLQQVVTTFASSVDRVHTTNGELLLGPLSYDRLVAVEHRGVQLLRPGSPFLDAVEEMVRCDDRGAAFAMWRPVSGIDPDEARVYFRFDFVVEANLAAAEAAVRKDGGATEALRRIADSALPPIWRTIWIDANTRFVTEPGLLAVLERPFDKRRGDTNLRLERWDWADQICPVHDWPGLCAKAHSAARHSLFHDADFQSKLDSGARRFKEASDGNHFQAETRISLLSDSAARFAELKAAAYASRIDQLILDGVRAPKARVDSMGAVYLAGADLARRRR
jgi:ATP-dependent helicase HepA